LTEQPPASQGRSWLPDLGPRGEGWVIGQFVLLGLLAVLGAPGLASLPTSLIGWLRVFAGLAGIVLGGWLILRGFADLGDNLTPMPRPRSDARLVEAGVYRRLRHPIYAGLIWAAFGWAGMTARLGALLVAVLLALFLDAKARREEAWLMDRYPAYASYRRRSKRFVPGIY
jgi:protein-S-isoprenylcysteine O-methyltransferase Ste14